MTDGDDRLLRPDVDDPHAGPFWAHCTRHELRIQRCSACQRLRFPPRPRCPWCRSTDTEWAAMSGRGRVWSYVKPHPPLLAPYTDVAPYNVVVVELDEDPTIRLVGNLVTGPDGPINEIDADAIAIGEPVEVVFADVAPGVSLPRWRRRG